MTYDSDARRTVNLVHGGTVYGKRSREFQSWLNMRHRCANPHRPDYRHYGGRGIRVCKRWQKFANFLSDMGRCPAGMTLERKNVNGHYHKRNCCWASRKEQRINQRSRVNLITFNGVTMCLKDWGRAIGASQGAMQRRWRAGWPISRMLTERPIVGKNQFSGAA